MTSNLLFDFIPVAEFYPLAEAILRTFHKYGTEERKNRNRARMKFLIARIGFDNFKELVLQEFEAIKKVRKIDNELEHYITNFPLPAPTKNGREDGPQNHNKIKFPLYDDIETENEPLWNTFLEKYIIKQKQPNYFALLIKPPLGNLTPDQLNVIADFDDSHAEGFLRTTPTQKILIPWIEEKFLKEGLTPRDYDEILYEFGKDFHAAEELFKVLLRDGKLVKLTEKIVIHKKFLDEVEKKVREYFQ
jgi:sulfite reductase beta subunit-like hemoprotein